MSIWDSSQALWKLNDHAGNGSWLDVSTTNNNTLVGTGTPLPAAGHTGVASAGVALNGSTQQLSILDGAQTGLDLGTNDWSLVSWVTPTSNAAQDVINTRCIMAKGDSGSPNRGYALFYDTASNGHRIQFLMSNSGTNNNVFMVAANSQPLDQPMHVAVTYDHANIRIYVNNSEVITPKSHSADVFVNTEPFRLNAFGKVSEVLNAGYTNFDDAGVWTRCLSSNEIDTLFTLGQDFGMAPAGPTATIPATLSLEASIAAQKLLTAATVTTTLAGNLTITPLVIKPATISPTLIGALAITPFVTGIASLAAELTGALAIDALVDRIATVTTTLGGALSIAGTVTTTPTSVVAVAEIPGGSGRLLIAETRSLGTGGFYSSSVYLIDQFKGLTGYTQSASSDLVIIINQSVNSAFTSAVSAPLAVSSLNAANDYEFISLPGRYVKYTVNSVSSSTQIEFNMFGNLN